MDKEFMKEFDMSIERIMDDIYFIEMAKRLPDIRVSKKVKLIVVVGQNESGNIPHFHIFYNQRDREEWKRGACLMYEENKYFDHGKNDKTLKKDELDVLVEFLKEKYTGNDSVDRTNWEQIVIWWNDMNPLFPIPNDIEMPEYNNGEILRYKK